MINEAELDENWVLPHGTVNTVAALADLNGRVAALERILQDVMPAPHVHGVDLKMKGPRSAVLIQRHGLNIEARHCTVNHQEVLNASSALRKLARSNWAFVAPNEIGKVLDELGVAHGQAFGVGKDAHESA